MKKYIVVILIIIGCNVMSGQDVPLAKLEALEKMFSNIPRRTNMIVLTVANTEGSRLLKTIKLFLADKNIFPSMIDADLGLINTQEIPKKTGTAKYSFRIIEKDSLFQIRIVGSFKSGMEISMWGVTSTDEWARITKRGMDGSIYSDNFEYMADLAMNLAINLNLRGVEFIDDTKPQQNPVNSQTSTIIRLNDLPNNSGHSY